MTLNAVDDVIEPVWLWPQRTMPPTRGAKRCPANRNLGLAPPTIVGSGDGHHCVQPNTPGAAWVLT
jgi:hypothetical protein